MESCGGGLFPSSPPPPPPPPPPPGREPSGVPPTPKSEDVLPAPPTLTAQPSVTSVTIQPSVTSITAQPSVREEREERKPLTIQPSMKEDDKPKDARQPVAQKSPSGRWNRYETRLGVGSFKQVFLGLDAQEAKEVAWNTIKLDCLTVNDKARVQAEVALLTRLKHKNILVMYDTWIDDETQELYLITSRMANTLKEHVAKLHPLQPAVIKKFCRQILSALVYLHQGVADTDGSQKPIIHRDLKCDNIFIDGPTGDVKVGDFGLAEFFDKLSGEDGKQAAGTMEGTLGFIAPELLQEQPYTERVDVYAFGMCVLEMATNEYPFSECGNKFLTLLQKSSQNLQPEALAKVEDPALKKFIEQCLLPAEQRPSAKELLENTYYPLAEEVANLPPSSLEVEARVGSSLDMTLKIVLRLTINGQKKTIQFDYDVSKDTPMSLAREIQTDVLKDQQFPELEADIVAKLTDAVEPAIKKLRHLQLTDLLHRLELEQSLTELFAKGGVTIVDLPLLQESDWERLGVPIGPRRRLQQAMAVAPPPSPAGLNPAAQSNGSFNANNAGPVVSPPASPPPSSPVLSPSTSTVLPPLQSPVQSPVAKPIPPATPTSGVRRAPGPPVPLLDIDDASTRLANTSLSGPPPPPKPPPKP